MKKIIVIITLILLISGCSTNIIEDTPEPQFNVPPKPTTTLSATPELTIVSRSTKLPSTMTLTPTLVVETENVKMFDAGKGASYQVQWHPFENVIATTGENTIHLWYLDEDVDKPITGINSRIIRGLEWSPDGSFLASAGDDKFVRVWNDTTLVTEFETSSSAYGVSWKNENIIAASTSDGSIYIYDIHNEVSLIILNTGEVTYNLSWSPDGQYLAAGVKTGKIFIYDSENFGLVHEFYGEDLQDPFLNSLAWSPDGQRLASMHDVGEIIIWHVNENIQDVFIQKTTCQLNCLDWSPDGEHLLIGGYDGKIRIISSHTGETIVSLSGPANLLSGSVGWSPTGNEIVTVFDNYWEFSSEKILHIWSPIPNVD